MTPRVASELAAFNRRTPRAFDQALAEVSPADRRADTARHGHSGDVYPYRTDEGIRRRLVYRRSDRMQTTKRGFTSERSARDGRRRLVEQVERGEVRHTEETSGRYCWTPARGPRFVSPVPSLSFNLTSG